MFHRCSAVTHKPVRWTIAMLLAAGPVAGIPAWAEGSNSAVSSAPLRAGATVTLDFANAEIDAVARTLATITGRNVVVDPRVKGTMTLQSTAPVTPAEALRLFSAQLRAQGYALVDSAGIYVVVPEADAKLQSAGVSAGPARTIRGGGQIQTQIFRLTHESAGNLVPVLRPLISPNNTINVDAGTNALVITDYGDNLQRIARIIAALDVANATGVEVVRLHYAVASDLAPLVAKLLEPGGGPLAANAAPNAQQVPRPGGNVTAASVVSGGDGYRTTLIPEPRSNAIIVRAANPARLALVKSLIEQLDQPADTRGGAGEGGNIHVVYLKNADAAKLAVALRAALAALPGPNNRQNEGAASGGNNAANTATTQAAQNTSPSTNGGTSSTGLDSGPSINAAANNQPSTGGQIQADPATNSLIISGPEPVYRELRAVIDKLDQRRAQVYIESMIAEIDTNREADLGIQWQSFLGRNGSANVGYIGSNFGSVTAGNIFGVSGTVSNFLTNPSGDPSAVVSLPNPGFNLGLLHNFGAGYVLSALANFIQSSGSGNVLSTPTLLTLDNEEARIMVGQNVPIVTGSYTNTGSSSTSLNPFQTYDREDVGITLRVRPQISQDGSIKLVVYQEVSSIVAGTNDISTNPAGPTTNKQAIESSVIVNDGQIVVLGGLLSDEVDTTQDKVPVLGDIPVVGNLFKNQTRTRTKKNLMLFLRPVIVRDAAASESYSLDRYQYMRALQQGTQPTPSSMLDVGQAPVMPVAAPVNPQTVSRPAPPMSFIPSDAGLPSPQSPQSFMPATGDRSDDSGAPIKTER
jgi:general secretion pathway protein D